MLVLGDLKSRIGQTFGCTRARRFGHEPPPRFSEDGLEPSDTKGEGGSNRRHRTGRGFALAGYGNPDVKVLVNMRPIYPVGVITGESDYPAPDKIRQAVTALSARACLLDATAEAVNLGSDLGNIIMIGAVEGLGVLPVSREYLRPLSVRECLLHGLRPISALS